MGVVAPYERGCHAERVTVAKNQVKYNFRERDWLRAKVKVRDKNGGEGVENFARLITS